MQPEPPKHEFEIGIFSHFSSFFIVYLLVYLILGVIVTESRPIATYLCDKYGKDDKLYPKDLAIRAIVDARLYFDIGTFYKAFGDCVVIFVTYIEIIYS